MFIPLGPAGKRRLPPFVTIAIIVVNVVIHVATLGVAEDGDARVEKAARHMWKLQRDILEEQDAFAMYPIDELITNEVTGRPMPQPAGFWGRWERGDIKSISLLGNVLARQISYDRDALETIMFRNGFLTEAAASNVWIVHEGAVLGPPKSEHVLEGIRYELIKELCEECGIAYNLRPIAEGEVNQLTAQRRVETSEDHYLDIISAKTAALFAAACRIAAVVAERDEAVEEALDAYGRNLGIAFQLIDDAIDYASDAATMGKGVGDDFRDGKVTLPVILAFARGEEGERQFWREAIEGRRNSDEDLAHATRLLRRHGALDDTIDRARHYGQRAIDALGPFPVGKAKAALVEAVEFAISRAY